MNYHICMSLIGFKFPTIRRPSDDSVDYPTIWYFLRGGRVGSRGASTSNSLTGRVCMEGVEWRMWSGGCGVEDVEWRRWSGGCGVEGGEETSVES